MYIVEEFKSYSEIETEVLQKVKSEKLPLVCLSGLKTEHPFNFQYVVWDQENNLIGKFIHLKDAKDYAEYLSYK